MNKTDLIILGECIDCNKTYDITYGELLYFKDKSIPLPKRCNQCRDIRKNNYKAKITVDKYKTNITTTEDGWHEYAKKNRFNGYNNY